MKRLVTLPLVALVALYGCSKPRPVVVLDSWWNAGAAKKVCQASKDWMQANQVAVTQQGCAAVKSCPEMTARMQACATSDTGGLEAFEAKIATPLANCAGVQFVQFRSPDEQREATAEASQQWQLMIEFDPAQPSQVWTLTGPSSEYSRSTGTPEEIADHVCSIVRSRRTPV
ncbi:MAG: hypothetical protein KGJ78_02735 [Alphaproteobacteria bacterium]|nr:hypothetical protein [Alphaproteobacteria bacterium]